jgi:hypothetical protein
MKYYSSRRRVSQRKRFLFLVIQMWVVLVPLIPMRKPVPEMPFGDENPVLIIEPECWLSLATGTSWLVPDR